MPSSRLSGDKYQFYKSLVWLNQRTDLLTFCLWGPRSIGWVTTPGVQYMGWQACHLLLRKLTYFNKPSMHRQYGIYVLTICMCIIMQCNEIKLTEYSCDGLFDYYCIYYLFIPPVYLVGFGVAQLAQGLMARNGQLMPHLRASNRTKRWFDPRTSAGFVSLVSLT